MTHEDGYNGAWDSCHRIRPDFTSLNGRQEDDDDYLGVKVALDAINGELKKERERIANRQQTYHVTPRRMYYLMRASEALETLMEEKA